jgi:hypothetical protein
VTQTITSAETSVKQVPAILNKIVQIMRMPEAYFASLRDVLDVGGGKYDLLTDRLAEMGIRNWVLDPFNRSDEHNAYVKKMLTAHPADMAICSNVLNVIKEPEERASVHKIIKDLTDPREQRAYFTVYEGDGTSKGKKTSKGWQANKPTKAYVRELRKYYYSVTLCQNKLIVCEGFKP